MKHEEGISIIVKSHKIIIQVTQIKINTETVVIRAKKEDAVIATAGTTLYADVPPGSVSCGKQGHDSWSKVCPQYK